MKTITTMFLLAAVPALADTITTISGTTYSEASVTKTTPTAISIMHSTGTAKIPFKDLPAATQKKYGYDPAKAAEYEEQEAQRQAEQKQRAEAQKIQAEKEIAERERARAAKEQAALAQEQARQQAAAQAEVDAKKKLLSETTPLILITTDPKLRVPFLINAKIEISQFYGITYDCTKESHFAFRIWGEKWASALGYMRREKGEALRQAITAKGGIMKAIIKGIYLPELFNPNHSDEFEILEVIEQ
jgi:ATPase subunit of ABC transporter with duplicated ATPase domains